jgi:hypothetical protein
MVQKASQCKKGQDSHQSKVEKREESKEKQSYGLRKRDPNFSFSEIDLANKQSKDDKNSGYAMLIMPDLNFIIDKPVCYIGRDPNWNEEETDYCWLLKLPNQENNKSISKISARVFFSSKLNEFCIENVGKNAIMVDRRSLKKSGKGTQLFRPLRNEACVQISSSTFFFILPKEVLYKKKFLRENRKTLLFDKISKIWQKQVGAKEGQADQTNMIKDNSNELFQEAPNLSIKDLILLYKNNQLGIDLPKSLEDKYFLKNKKVVKGNISQSAISESDR